VEFRLGAQPLLGWLIIGPLAGYGVNKGEGSCATLGAAPVDYQPIFVSGCLRRQIRGGSRAAAAAPDDHRLHGGSCPSLRVRRCLILARVGRRWHPPEATVGTRADIRSDCNRAQGTAA